MGGDKFKYKPKRGNIRNEKASTYQIGPKQGRMQNIDVNQRTIPKKSEDGSDQFYKQKSNDISASNSWEGQEPRQVAHEVFHKITCNRNVS